MRAFGLISVSWTSYSESYHPIRSLQTSLSVRFIEIIMTVHVLLYLITEHHNYGCSFEQNNTVKFNKNTHGGSTHSLIVG